MHTIWDPSLVVFLSSLFCNVSELCRIDGYGLLNGQKISKELKLYIYIVCYINHYKPTVPGCFH